MDIASKKIFNITPPDKFGEMHTIEFSSGISKMVQHDSFELYPETSRLTLVRKYPENSPALEESHRTQNPFAKTHQYHQHTT